MLILTDCKIYIQVCDLTRTGNKVWPVPRRRSSRRCLLCENPSNSCMASGLQNLVPKPGRGSVWTFLILVVSVIVILSACGSMPDSDKEKRSETASGGATGVADDAVQRLKRTLTACKSWLTRSHNILEQLVSDTEPDNATDEFEKRLNSFVIRRTGTSGTRRRYGSMYLGRG